MKQRITLIFGALFMSMLFSACCIQHNWKDATCTEPKTCAKCGETMGEAIGHTWTAATCEAPKTCNTCKATEGEALGHLWLEATCERAKTCATCHATEGEALGHSWVDATCALPKTCSVCAKTEGTALTIEDDLLNHEGRADILVNIVRGQVSQYPTIYKDFYIELEGNEVHYIYYYQDALIPDFDTLRQNMFALDWESMIKTESYGFSQLYGVTPDAIYITYMLGDKILFSTFELE